jgi:hypothetical protein
VQHTVKKENRSDKWLINQFNRNRLPKDWVATVKDINTNNKYYANREVSKTTKT